MSPRSSRWAERRAKLATYNIQHIVSYKNEDKCVLSLRDEAMQARSKERHWYALRDELAELEASFKSVWDHKLAMELDFNAKQDMNNK